MKVPEARVLPNLTSVLNGLTLQLKSIELNQTEEKVNLVSMREEKANLESAIIVSLEKVQVAGLRYTWFQELKSYTESLADFMDEKVK